MHPRRYVLALAVAGALAAACGGGHSSKAHVTATNGHPDPVAIAAKIGCSGYAASTGQLELFVAAAGDCTYQGDSVTIVTFASSDAFTKWRDAAKAATGGDGTTVLGDRYAVEASNADQAAAIAAAVGGTTQ